MPKNSDQNDALDERFAENMRRLRARRNLSQGELALRLQKAGLENFHQTTVSRVEKGERQLRIGEAGVVARELGVTLDEMLRPAGEESLLEALDDVSTSIAEMYEQIHNDAVRLLRAHRSAHVLLAEATRQGRGPMDTMDVLSSSPEFIAEWTAGRTVEGRARHLQQILHLEPERAVKDARLTFERQQWSTDGVDPEA